jgi:CPA2 family monovalent cation:H+ antiporter-2
MLIDPATILEYKWPVLWVTLLTLFGKFFSTTLGALLSGQPLKQSVQVGMSMAQIGEFAFIVATLGLSLGVISDFLFPVAVGASAITTFTTPYMIKFSGRFYELLVRILPERWVKALNNYSSTTQDIQAESSWKAVFKGYANIAMTNGIVLLALMFISREFFLPFLQEYIEDPVWRSLIGLVISMAIASPFLWALMAKKPNNMAYKELWLDKNYSHGPLLVMEIARNILGILLIGFWVAQFFSRTIAVLVALPVVIIVLILFSKRIQAFYQRLEGRFLTNLNAREKAVEDTKNLALDELRRRANANENLTPWDVHMINLEVSQDAEYIGKTLVELAWREKYGINIAYIKRGDKLIYAPKRNNKLLPFDLVGIIATDDQMHHFKPVFDAREKIEVTNNKIEDVILQNIVVDENTGLKGQSIRASGIRENTNGLVVGIERNGERILNPDSSTIFEWNDIVWIVGERSKIQSLNTERV